MKSSIAEHQLILFIGSVFIVEWVISLSLFGFSPLTVGLIAFVPAPVALGVVLLKEGRVGARRLLKKSLEWSLDIKWYLLVVAVPVAIHLLAVGVVLYLGVTPAPSLILFLSLLPVTIILAIGEEIGWHGHAIPLIRKKYSPVVTALLFGVIHAAFHLPMFLLPLPEEFRQSSPFWLFLLMATAYSIFRIWFFDRTSGNIPLAIVYHAAINTSVLLVNGVAPEIVGWVLPLVWVSVIAVALLAYVLVVKRTASKSQKPAVGA